MAIAKKDVDKIKALYLELFHEDNPVLIDRKQDGGYESVSTYQGIIHGDDLEKVARLSREIGNSFCVRPVDNSDKLRLTFF